MASRVPSKLIVILGCTGTGKTDLSLRIAKKYNGEIVNCDSMQIYKHLEILTNKPTKSEFESCPHHLFNIFNPNEPCNSWKFQDMALPLIQQIQSRGGVPILVGGTNLYIDAILFDYIFTYKMHELTQPLSLPAGYQDISEFENEDPKKLHSILKEIDPVQAKLLHPNDTRKNIGALTLYYRTGKRMSELVSEQKRETGADSPTGPLRFEDPCIIWLDCEKGTLYDRIDKRVDTMMERGLQQEIQDFYVKDYLNYPIELRSKGLFQAIGFKEWLPYLEEWHRGEHCDSADLYISNLKLQTRKYARYQLGWIRNRYVLKRGERELQRFYKLDTTDPYNWENNVVVLADEIVSAYLKGEYPNNVLPVESVPSTVNTTSYNFCDKCQLILIGDNTLQAHLRSRGHKARALKFKRLQILLNNHETIQSKKVQSQVKKKAVADDDEKEDVFDALKNLF